MAMTTGKRGGHVSAINMTPMIDVLLVLLIIFMVVQQGLQRGLSVQVPPPKEKEELTYKDVIRAVDASRAAGVTVVGLVPRPTVGQATVTPAPGQ